MSVQAAVTNNFPFSPILTIILRSVNDEDISLIGVSPLILGLMIFCVGSGAAVGRSFQEHACVFYMMCQSSDEGRESLRSH